MNYISLSKEADEKVALGKFEEAKTLLEKGLSLAKRNKNKSFVEFFLGELQTINHNYQLAIPHYKKAMEMARKIEFKAFFLKNMGVTFSLSGREEEAIKCFDRALKIKPNDYDSLRQKGVSLSKLEREEEAIELYDRALEIKPDDYNSLRNKGVSLSKLEREKEAIECFDRALKIKPDDYDSLRQKGVSLSELGRKEEAIELFDRALEIKPDDYDSLREKGLSLSKLGRMEEAIKCFDHVLEIKPENYDFLRQKGVSLSKLEREEEAIELFDRALEIKPDDYDSLREKGLSLSKMGRKEEAIELYDLALNIKPDDYNSLRNKGISLGILGKLKESIECFDRALEIKHDDYNSLRSKGVSLYKLGRVEEAIECFDLALKIRTDDWLSLVYKAFTLESKGEIKKATEIFDFIALNENKIKDEEIIKVSNFKKNALKEKEQDKKTDVLNEVINAFQENKDDFFKSINDIESRFKKFVDSERSIPEGFFSFLSVLRKWNSYTPILPSEKGDNKGGGYFLYHYGKGIVIDPGFNFIENFYQEGFKVADIDAVLITHAHNDHTVDLESILTLVYKHNDAIKDAVKEKTKRKKIDLLVNVGTFMKYSGWLNLKDSNEVNSITVLMPNTTYKLPQEYHGITIHTTKAKHHEIIDEQYAIGFILNIDGIKIGFTGDTGWDWDREETMVKPFIEHNPRLVVAHLGSIKSQEFKYVEATCDAEKNKCFYAHHLGLLGITKFLDETKPDLTVVSEFGEELRGMRKEIVERIGKVLGLKCLPGDIGLHIRLSDLGIYCFVEEDFIDYNQIQVSSNQSPDGSTLYYHRNESFYLDKNESILDIFKFPLERKRLAKAVPLADRLKQKTD